MSGTADALTVRVAALLAAVTLLASVTTASYSSEPGVVKSLTVKLVVVAPVTPLPSLSGLNECAVVGGNQPLHARLGATAYRDGKGLEGGLAHGGRGVLRLGRDGRRWVDGHGRGSAGCSHTVGVGDDGLVFG